MSFSIDSFKSLLEGLYDWPLGTVGGILVLLTILIALGLLVWWCFIALDSWFLSRKRGVGKIVRKTFKPAHMQTILIYSPATKSSLPQLIPHPDNWLITLEVSGCQDSLSVDEDIFNALKEGESVAVSYVRGRISNRLYFKSIYPHDIATSAIE